MWFDFNQGDGKKFCHVRLDQIIMTEFFQAEISWWNVRITLQTGEKLTRYIKGEKEAHRFYNDLAAALNAVGEAS